MMEERSDLGFADEAIRLYAEGFKGTRLALIDEARDAVERKHYHRALFFLRAADIAGLSHPDLANLRVAILSGLVEQSWFRREDVNQLEERLASMTELFDEVFATVRSAVNNLPDKED